MKNLKKLEAKAIQNVKHVKGGNGEEDDLLKNLGGTNDLKKRTGI